MKKQLGKKKGGPLPARAARKILLALERSNKIENRYIHSVEIERQLRAQIQRDDHALSLEQVEDRVKRRMAHAMRPHRVAAMDRVARLKLSRLSAIDPQDG